MQITRGNLLVLVIGLAIGWLIPAFVPALGVNAGTLALVVAVLIWLLRVAPRPDMPFSLIGVIVGLLVALVVVGMRSVVGPDTALLGTWLLLALAA